MENTSLYLINKIIKATIAYDKTDDTLKPLTDAIFEYLTFCGYGKEYVVYVDDDMNVKIMHQKVENEEIQADVIED